MGKPIISLLVLLFLTAGCTGGPKELGAPTVTTIYPACDTDQCWIDAVKATGDGTLCQKVKGYEEGYYCTIEYAKAKNDSLICDGMFNPGWRDRCRESFANKT